jgi:hypothetical protein
MKDTNTKDWEVRGELRISNFNCSAHGKIKPTPRCPTCDKETQDALVDMARQITLAEERWRNEVRNKLDELVRNELPKHAEMNGYGCAIDDVRDFLAKHLPTNI